MKKTTNPLEETNEPLFPPVLPSWGAMLPSVPPAGYGDVSFDPAEPGESGSGRPHRELTERDREMLARLPKILPTKRPA
jgi:hypothetical protein